MKNFGKIMALFAAVFMFSSITLSCSSDSGSDDGDDFETATTEDTLLETQIALYNSLIGTYEDLENDGEHLIKKLVLSENSITVDDKKYSFNPRTDFDTKILGADETRMVFTLDTTRYFLETSVSLSSAAFKIGNYETNKISYMKRVTSSSGGGSGGGDTEVVELSGTYSITGSSYGISFAADGTWTLTNGGRAAGTYVLNGSMLSVTSNASTAEFKLSVSGSTVTLDGSNDNYSTGILAVWGVQDSQALQNGKITITKSE